MENLSNIPALLTDLRRLKIEELAGFCTTWRQYIIDEVLQHGGHFSANLGTIELTAALHYVLNTPHDQLVWDVGHQAYLHKILTGREHVFYTIRKKDGISGFPKQSESEFDVFGTGHSSTSISAVLGLAEADKILNISRQHVAVIGDGSLTGGMAWEALNNAAQSKTNITIIINDNQMGIDPNAGALNNYLNSLDVKPNFFTDLGFEYYKSADGHDVEAMVNRLQSALQSNKPKVWHIKTIKGKGYQPAESEQTKWHAVKYVKIEDVDPPQAGDRLQDVFGQSLLDLASQNKKIVGITPAMPSGSSMKILMDALPNQCFDVGIAEQHAVTFSAGLATNGLIPFCNIYSTFFQRAYDQVIHDVCLQNLHVVFCLDRAGNVGEDGSTHHGMFDLSFLRCIPNLVIIAPSNEADLRHMMFTASQLNGPVAIRYPKGNGQNIDWQLPFKALPFGKSEIIRQGSDYCILALGPLCYEANIAADKLSEQGISVQVVNPLFVKPLDYSALDQIFEQFSIIVTVEDGCISGGYGSAVLEYANSKNYKGFIKILGYPDHFVDHGSREEILHVYQLDADGIYNKVMLVNQLI